MPLAHYPHCRAPLSPPSQPRWAFFMLSCLVFLYHLAVKLQLTTFCKQKDCEGSVYHATVLSFRPTWSQGFTLQLNLAYIRASTYISCLIVIHCQPLSMNKRRQQVKPEAQAGLYLMQVIFKIYVLTAWLSRSARNEMKHWSVIFQGGRVPPNPYHAYNSTYNPVSR